MGVGLAATHIWTLAVVGLGAAHARLTLFGLLRHRSQGYRATARAPQSIYPCRHLALPLEYGTPSAFVVEQT